MNSLSKNSQLLFIVTHSLWRMKEQLSYCDSSVNYTCKINSYSIIIPLCLITSFSRKKLNKGLKSSIIHDWLVKIKISQTTSRNCTKIKVIIIEVERRSFNAKFGMLLKRFKLYCIHKWLKMDVWPDSTKIERMCLFLI